MRLVCEESRGDSWETLIRKVNLSQNQTKGQSNSNFAVLVLDMYIEPRGKGYLNQILVSSCLTWSHLVD